MHVTRYLEHILVLFYACMTDLDDFVLCGVCVCC